MTNATTRATTPQHVTNTLLAAKDVQEFSFGPDMPDVRGWSIIGPASSSIGTVDRILLDAAERKPRYLSVKRATNTGSMLLPIGVAVADVSRQRITLDGVAPEVLKALPSMSSDTISPDFEREVVQAFLGRAVTGAPTDWYATPLFDGSRLRPSASLGKTGASHQGVKSAPATPVA